jgi:hypothetical protein
MKKLFPLILTLFVWSCGQKSTFEKVMYSPGLKTVVLLNQNEKGALEYSVTYNGKEVIAPSALGFEIEGFGTIGTASKFMVMTAVVYSNLGSNLGGRNRSFEIIMRATLSILKKKEGSPSISPSKFLMMV